MKEKKGELCRKRRGGRNIYKRDISKINKISEINQKCDART
jgi:hypothetical protein